VQLNVFCISITFAKCILYFVIELLLKCILYNTGPQVVVMEFGKQHDTTDTTDFCQRQLVADLLRGKRCNGFCPQLDRRHCQQFRRQQL